jgi:hypothetical protein
MTLDGAVGGDGGDGDPEGEAHRATAETLPEGQAQDLSDLSHGDRGSRHRFLLEQQFGAGWPGYLTSRQRYAEGLPGVHEKTGTGVRNHPESAEIRIWPRRLLGGLGREAWDFSWPQLGTFLAPSGDVIWPQPGTSPWLRIGEWGGPRWVSPSGWCWAMRWL